MDVTIFDIRFPKLIRSGDDPITGQLSWMFVLKFTLRP